MNKRKLPLFVAVLALFTANSVLGQDYKSIVENYLNNSSEGKNISNKEFIISSKDVSSSLKGTVVKIQQTYNGLPVLRNSSTLLIRDNDVLNFAGDFSNLQAKNADKSQTSAPGDILGKVISSLKISDPQSYKNTLDKGKMKKPVLGYYDNGKELVLSYELEFYEQNSSNLWYIIADAKTGNIYKKENLTLSCNFADDAYNREHIHNPELENSHNLFFPENRAVSVSPKLLNNASYRIFPLPVQAPSFGNRDLLTNPWDLTSSPYGWHKDHLGEFTITRGNNVYAYTDENSKNEGGPSADGGSSLLFDFPFDINQGLDSYRDAALTNLFYINNKVHDVLYKFGFVESAGNFQSYNFGKEGNQNDFVLAEARDGANVADVSLGLINNANFSTPSDGEKPRMQMYIWTGNGPYFKYNAPSSLSGTGIAKIGLAYFGTPLWKARLTGDVANVANVDACLKLPDGSLTGKIGIAKRGTCSFVMKVYNIQNAGATGAIIYNTPDAATVPGEEVSNMSWDGYTVINIPSVFIPQSKGENIVSLINNGENVNVTFDIPVRDGSFDNGIVSHEYGHGLSNRLTGDSVSCLNPTDDKEQMGEGWSDFLALMLTMNPDDNASIARSMGTYATFAEPDSKGIRLAKYSPDFSINNYTYGKTNGMEVKNNAGVLVPDVHSIGFIWASILWDLHWKYVEKYGFSNDIANNPNSGSAQVFQTVVNGMKLQACLPTFVSGRNAIIAADKASTGGENKCLIWNTFAKRGVGFKASAGSKININDQVEDFTVPEECALATNEVTAATGFSIYPNPAKNEVFLNFKNNLIGKVNIEIYDAAGNLVTTQKVDPSAKEAVNTQKLAAGVYVIKASGIGINYSTKLVISK